MRNWKNYYLSAAPYLVLAVALVATYFAWYALDQAVDGRIEQRFHEEVDETTNLIETRLRAYELMLRGGLGLFLASDGVTRAEFKSYVDILGLRQNYPGVQAFGYAEIVPGDGVAAQEQRLREEGFADYAVYPPGPRASYTTIVYIEPMNPRTRRAMGYDVSSEAVRLAALERARDSGNAAVTGKIRLVQEPQQDVQPGFSMFLPFYKGGKAPDSVEERRASIAGYIYAPFRMFDLMDGILIAGTTIVSFKLYDGAPSAENLMYDKGLPGADMERRHAESIIDIGGRRWTLRFTDSAAFRKATESFDPQAAAIGGVLVSLILFALTLLLRRMLFERRQSAEAMIETERKLAQAQKMESIGHLTGGVAHDFNNLLQVILGNNDLLVEELADRPKLRAMAEMSRAAAERGAELTHRLLSFARKQPLDPKATDLNKLVEGMDALLRRTLGAQVEVVSRLAGDLWPGLLDGAQMESAILNLCLNARDAMPNGGRVTIETANALLGARHVAENPDLAPGEYVMLAVADNGSGMDAETLARAFEPFFTTKDVGQGSGLGLSMVYGFIQQSKGHVKIESSPGQGTTVKLYVPRASQPMPAAAAKKDAENLPRGTEHVLLVEDDDLVREHVGAQLRGLGYRVLSAANGAAALVLLQNEPDIDLLFTDIVMPGGMNGRDLAEQARRQRGDLRILFTSGYTENAWPDGESRQSGSELLQKPYRRAELARKLRTVLDNPALGK